MYSLRAMYAFRDVVGPEHGGYESKQKGLRDRISPTCTLSQNGYGVR